MSYGEYPEVRSGINAERKPGFSFTCNHFIRIGRFHLRFSTSIHFKGQKSITLHALVFYSCHVPVNVSRVPHFLTWSRKKCPFTKIFRRNLSCGDHDGGSPVNVCRTITMAGKRIGPELVYSLRPYSSSAHILQGPSCSFNGGIGENTPTVLITRAFKLSRFPGRRTFQSRKKACNNYKLFCDNYFKIIHNSVSSV